MDIPELRKFMKSKYSKRARLDIDESLHTYPSLQLATEHLTFNDGSFQPHLVVKLTGTLPVILNGGNFMLDFPIDVYFLENYPNSPPIVYVRPSNTMKIKSNQHVDSSGLLVVHQLLTSWNHEKSKSKDLLNDLPILFAESPPLHLQEPPPSPPTDTIVDKPKSRRSMTRLGPKSQSLPLSLPEQEIPQLLQSSSSITTSACSSTSITMTTSLQQNHEEATAAAEIDFTECCICKENVKHEFIYRSLSCNCFVCIQCFEDHLTYQIFRLPASQWKCGGICGGQPKYQNGWNSKPRRQLLSSWTLFIENEEIKDKKNIEKMFKEKIRQFEMISTPGAVCCVNCNNIWKEENQNVNIKCPCECQLCKTRFCRFCDEMWTIEHQRMSCKEIFKKLYDDQIDSTQCPTCKRIYEKIEENCCSNECKRCGTSFCSCGAPFVTREECSINETCATNGKHCHHYRLCQTNLRTFSEEQLMLLITRNKFIYLRGATDDGGEFCDKVINLKENILCNETIYKEKLCYDHFQLRLIKIIQDTQVDPLDVLTNEELFETYERLRLPIPASDYVNDQQHRQYLINNLKKHWLLISNFENY